MILGAQQSMLMSDCHINKYAHLRTVSQHNTSFSVAIGKLVVSPFEAVEVSATESFQMPTPQPHELLYEHG